MSLAPDEFIRRFLLHVLPKVFHRIRIVSRQINRLFGVLQNNLRIEQGRFAAALPISA